MGVSNCDYLRIRLLGKERGHDSKITTAPQRQGPDMRGFKQGTSTVGNGRMKNTLPCQVTNEHPKCSFDRYNNLISSRHIKLGPRGRFNSLRVCA